jgi:DNA mismatch repair protein MutL
MPKISILAYEEAQKIAAGEVVERPASVVKELLENAIDAGATQISLIIEEGGKKLIRCIDNGCGMSPEDARLSVLHHATSKIKLVEELPTITTFGFRGEALSSIAAVSTMKLITRTHDADAGIELTIKESAVISEQPAACNCGTEIRIADLFYNVPARKKFLKTDVTEWRAIQTLVQAYALDYPQLAITLTHNQTAVLTCTPCTTLKQRAEQLFDRPVIEHSIDVSASDTGAKVAMSGIITDHQFSRYDRSQIYFFVNNRWVKNQKLGSALCKGYRNVLPQGQYPQAVICITIDPQEVDINVHPRKEEVQFLHPRKIEALLEELAQHHLQEKISSYLFRNSAPSVSNTASAPIQSSHIPVQHVQPNFSFSAPFTTPASPTLTLSQYPDTTAIADVPQPPMSTALSAVCEEQPFTQSATACQTTNQQELFENVSVDTTPTYKIIGQLDATYIMIETDEGLVLIDQHAAHERVMYEIIGTRLAKADSIQLLFPEFIPLTPSAYATVVPHLDLIKQYGIDAQAWENNQILIRATPPFIKSHASKEIVQALVTALQETGDITTQDAQKRINHTLQAMMACKAAVKAHDTLSMAQMESLLKQLFELEHRLTCPHGRPTTWLLSRYEIEKKFKRVG